MEAPRSVTAYLRIPGRAALCGRPNAEQKVTTPDGAKRIRFWLAIHIAQRVLTPASLAKNSSTGGAWLLSHREKLPDNGQPEVIENAIVCCLPTNQTWWLDQTDC
jgi:hypothetical protein